jgi:hypothetical protein
MSSLSKGETIGTNLIELFANQMVKKRNMINDYLRRRACIKSVRGVLILSFRADFRESVDFELLC